MIPKELLKGSLKPIVLKLLSEHERMYGYEITQKVKELTAGKIKLTYGALYPVLHKLENDGVLTTEREIVNGRTRIYYRLTATGNDTVEEKLLELQEFIDTMRRLLNPDIRIAPWSV